MSDIFQIKPTKSRLISLFEMLFLYILIDLMLAAVSLIGRSSGLVQFGVISHA